MKIKRGFKCGYCQKWVPIGEPIGTSHRNHCPFCLWSKHTSSCGALMAPIGLTFKHEGWDKYTKLPKQGELMLIHQCGGCAKFSINRIAADDNPQVILSVFEESKSIASEIHSQLEKENIKLLTEKDKEELNAQLFGKNS